MKENIIKDLFNDFRTVYDAEAKDQVWAELSSKFREFWRNKIIDGVPDNLTDSSIDEIIRILDRSGKGNKKNDEAIAQVMIAQGTWRRLFHTLCSNKLWADIINNAFIADYSQKQAEYIDALYKINEGNKNYLTGSSGNFINTVMAAFDPANNLTVISFKDRMGIIKYFDLPLTFDPEKDSIGTCFAESNRIIIDSFKSMGINESARTISCFFYHQPVKDLWKGGLTVNRTDKKVEVTVPEDSLEAEEEISADPQDPRESILMQAKLSEIGTQMGFKIWLPKGDRSRVLKNCTQLPEGALLENLPLGYDPTTMKTIENIDVLWLRGRSIARAFEVEHTTSIYSGILRMADLLALQPNINIKLHIVAPVPRREKVFEEIQRPVFSLLESGAMSEFCTYLSYDSIKELSAEKHLSHLSDSVLDDYAEIAE